MACSKEAPESVAQANAEPTEKEMRQLLQAEVDRINAEGGLRLTVAATGRSVSVRMKLEDFRKTGCQPYTKAFRCEGEVTYSYPDSDFPTETLPHSDRYRRDDQGRWSIN